MKPKSSMTKRWVVVLDFVRAYTKIHGIPPSYDAIARGLGMKSRSNIHRMIKRLEEEGYVLKTPGKFYSIRLVDDRSILKL